MTDHRLDGPADTRMMGVVHSALRRDLVRTRLVLTTATLSDVRRRAVAEHVQWLTAFLHEHHGGEDAGLYPLVRRRDPALASLLDAMDDEHAAIEPAMAALEDASRAWALDAGAADRLRDALDDLEGVLLPHLRHEELEMMPRVSAAITHREWVEWDQRTFIRTKTKPALAFAGHWMVDNASPSDREAITSMVPPVPRFVLLHLLGGPYRRRRALLWAGTAALDVPPLTVRAVDNRSGEPGVLGS